EIVECGRSHDLTGPVLLDPQRHPQTRLLVGVVGQLDLVAIHADESRALEGNGRAPGRMDLQHEYLAVWVRHGVEAEVRPRAGQLLQPHNQALVTLTLGTEGIERGAV